MISRSRTTSPMINVAGHFLFRDLAAADDDARPALQVQTQGIASSLALGSARLDDVDGDLRHRGNVGADKRRLALHTGVTC
jgi:hypothetical protein